MKNYAKTKSLMVKLSLEHTWGQPESKLVEAEDSITASADFLRRKENYDRK